MHRDTAPDSPPAERPASWTDETALEDVDPTPTAPEPEMIPELILRLKRVEEGLEVVSGRLAAESDRAAARERVIDRQHEDIERLRAVERTGLMRPVVTDLCRLRNDLLRQARTCPPEMTGGQVSTLLSSFADLVEQALDRCGIAVLHGDRGDPFDAARHQVARAVPVDDAALDATIAEVVQDGYAEGDRVVLKARVAVHRASPLSASTSAEPDRPDAGEPQKETSDE
jgi:molecular chaperone GrpE